ncbi:hypothetical protein B0H17DRAFT_1097730 [Mycena rosella]|uniref:Uncharacterized protein n=1 Tax=Mycena rosella TaxID=1033263 RepID=A0AAD7CPY9_MYCRO|nr:hypothetical protein B0H17DRAFT_1097730 [Mycena rosella]
MPSLRSPCAAKTSQAPHAPPRYMHRLERHCCLYARPLGHHTHRIPPRRRLWSTVKRMAEPRT